MTLHGSVLCKRLCFFEFVQQHQQRRVTKLAEGRIHKERMHKRNIIEPPLRAPCQLYCISCLHDAASIAASQHWCFYPGVWGACLLAAQQQQYLKLSNTHPRALINNSVKESARLDALSITLDVPEDSSHEGGGAHVAYRATHDAQPNAEHGRVPKVEGGLKEPSHLGLGQEIVNAVEEHIECCAGERQTVSA